MSLPKEFEFEIADEVYVPAVNGTPPQTFGPEFSGKFKLNWPKVDDRDTAFARVVRHYEAKGVANPASVAWASYSIIFSLYYLRVLAGDHVKQLPDWFAFDAPDFPKARAAIVRAHEVAERVMTEKKSSSDGGGASSSTKS